MEEQRLIEVIAEAIQDKKGKGVVSLDLSGMDGAICSHFTTQVCAIADSVEEAVFNKFGEWPWRVEGKQTGLWVAMDYIDVVVHIFQSELRDYYRLEDLWADAPMVEYEDVE